ncbi:MAG: DUF456 family protein [Bacteroidales bacterium]|nr:DUF456 family protein [Bacteroidales bacterium]
MTTVLMVLAVVFGLVGVIGSVIPGIPGPPLGWVGLLRVYLAGDAVSRTALLVYLALVVLVTVLDYVVPAKFTRMAGASKTAGRGALAGLFLGMFIPPVGMLIGMLIGAFAAEFLVEKKSAASSVKASLAAFLGFLAGTGLKLLVTGLLLYRIVSSLFNI